MEGGESPKAEDIAEEETIEINNLTEKYNLELTSQLPGFKQGISYLKFSENGKHLAIGYQTGGVRIYDMESNSYICELDIPKIKKFMDYDYDSNEVFFPITNIRWYTDSQVLYSSGDGNVKLCNIVDPDPTKRLRHQISNDGRGINGLDIDADKNCFVTGGMDHNLRVYDFSTMKEIHCYEGEDTQHSEHFNRIFSIIFDPNDPNIFYSGGWDKCILTHDVRESHSVSHFMGPYVAGDTLDICGGTLLAGNYTSKDPIELYDLTSGDQLDYITWDQEDDKEGGMIMTSQFGFPKTETIVAGSTKSHEVKIFSRETCKEVTTVTGFSGPVVALDMDHLGQNMVIGSKMGGAVLLSHTSGSE